MTPARIRTRKGWVDYLAEHAPEGTLESFIQGLGAVDERIRPLQKSDGIWTEQAREQVLVSFSGKPEHQEAARETEIKELRAKVGELVLERDFLSKAFGR